MSELVKEWLTTLLDEEIKTEKGTIDNERIWENGSNSEEEAEMHEQNIGEHEEYIKVLEEIKREYCA